MKGLAKKFKMKHHTITAYHPQANGLVERFNGTLKQMLAKVSEEIDDWDQFIAPTLFAYRTSPIASIGTSPAMLEFGRVLRLPKESLHQETIWERIKHMVTQMPTIRSSALEHLINQQHKETPKIIKETQFQVGDSVLVHKTWLGKTMKPKWEGPFTIIKVFSHGTYAIIDKDGGTSKPINGDRLRLYKDRLYLEPIVVIEN